MHCCKTQDMAGNIFLNWIWDKIQSDHSIWPSVSHQHLCGLCLAPSEYSICDAPQKNNFWNIPETPFVCNCSLTFIGCWLISGGWRCQMGIPRYMGDLCNGKFLYWYIFQKSRWTYPCLISRSVADDVADEIKTGRKLFWNQCIFLVGYRHIMGSIANIIWLLYFHSAMKVWVILLAPAGPPM